MRAAVRWACGAAVWVGLVCTGLGWVLAAYIEGTPQAVADAQLGQAVAVPAVLAVFVGALGRIRRTGLRFARICAVTSVIAAAYAVIVYLTG